LDATVEEAIRRVKVRGREDELLMPEEYWKNLHECYATYYKGYNASSLLKIDVTNLDYVHRNKDRQFMIDTIAQYLRSKDLKPIK
jgi:deoxyadenosine/deoxycytidine kinase